METQVCELTFAPGVDELLVYAREDLLTAEEERGQCVPRIFMNKGDLSQMAVALKVARELKIPAGISGGIPYVLSTSDYEKVIEYIVDNKLEGHED